MDNLTVDEMFAIDAIELGMDPADLQAHFDSEIDDNGENNDVVIDIVIENVWNVDPYGNQYFPYTVNGIRCTLWDTDPQFILEYGDNVYIVDENSNVYDEGVYIGMLTTDGDIHNGD
jgi:hypothetical protein